MSDWKEELRKLAESQGMKLADSPSESAKKSPETDKGTKQTKNIRRDANPDFSRAASAPYNFVPLSENVIAADETRTTNFDIFLPSNTQNGTRNLTGHIELEIENVTPLFVRGTQDPEEAKKDKKEAKRVATFYAPGGKLAIPGSSIRGMLRAMVEMISWSRIKGDFKFSLQDQESDKASIEPKDHGRHLYYRGLADRSNLRQAYQKRMSSFDRKNRSVQYKMSAGYLKKCGRDYCITPAKQINNRQFDRIPKHEANEFIKKSGKRHDGTYAYSKREDGVMVVSTGEMPNKKKQWLINPEDSPQKAFKIPEQDIVNYRGDTNREAADLIALLDKDTTSSLPCFYTKWFDKDGFERVAFGHTAMFRLPYQTALHELVPAQHNNMAKVDFAEALFGKLQHKRQIAGRVFIEDAILQNPENVQKQRGVSEILGSPKPTTFQHYLVQNSEFIRELNHYDSDTYLRGHKLYWHRKKDWRRRNELEFKKTPFDHYMKKHGVKIPSGVVVDRPSSESEPSPKVQIPNFIDLPESDFKDKVFDFILEHHDAQYTVMEALKPGAQFRGRVRFENLSEEELGSLLCALQLPEHCRHKLGLGKPLGMGSVKVKARLALSDRKRRYQNLLSEWDTPTPEVDDAEMSRLREQFETFTLSELAKMGEDVASVDSIWQTERLQELHALLDWRNVDKENWVERTRYLEIQHSEHGNEYNDRKVLPGPRTVLDEMTR